MKPRTYFKHTIDPGLAGRRLKQSVAAVATSREGHRWPRSDRRSLSSSEERSGAMQSRAGPKPAGCDAITTEPEK